jgi:chemotaxis response regulator CheB
MATEPRALPWVVAIGASAGGVEPICRLLAALPSDLPAVVLVALHRHRDRVSYLPRILRRHAHMPVVVPDEGERLQPGVCYLGDPGAHLSVGPGLAAHMIADASLDARSVDLLFLALARNAGPHTIGVVLSGLLSDGAHGLAAIKASGGFAMVQEPGEAAYMEMPQSAIQLGPVDYIGPVEGLAKEICLLLPRAVSGRGARPAPD